MEKLSIPSGIYPGIGYDGSVTFSGVLQDVFYQVDAAGVNIGLSRKWNDNTTAQYSRDYTERLLPAISKTLGAETPMYTYTEVDFENILIELRKTYHYADHTIMHYRYLLWIVYRAGLEKGLYADNIFWDELIDPLENPEEFEKHRVSALTRIRKSFSIAEDLKIMHWFFSLNSTTATGEDIGLICMYFLGCRNNEACGADFSAFHPLHSHPETAVFDMVQTTVIGSNRSKSGGKSSNAPRTLPVPSILYEFIQKRRTWLERQIEEGILILPKEIHSVDQLPVACVGNHYTTRTQTTNLSKAGRTLFQKIGIHKSELAVLHQILFSEEFKQTQIIEKDPTTYLFRRNVATRLYHLGFKWTTIQYWIAHEIEDTLIMRNHFADEDILQDLGQQYEKHPIFNVMFDKSANQHIEKHTLAPTESLYLIATAKEPGDTLALSVESTHCPVQTSVTELPSIEQCSTNVDILNSLYYAYIRTYKQFSK